MYGHVMCVLIDYIERGYKIACVRTKSISEKDRPWTLPPCHSPN